MLDQSPVYEVLNMKKGQLTPKQLKYCEKVARGEKHAEAYRNSFNSKGKPQTQANEAYKLAKRPEIATMIEQISMAIEASKSYTSANIKSMIVDRLIVESLDANSSPNARISAIKALGEIAGVNAFSNTTIEHKVVKSSDAKDELLSMLKKALADNARTINEDDSDVLSLLAEIEGGNIESEGPDTDTPPPSFLERDSLKTLHTIPDSGLPKNTPPEVIENKHE